MTTQDYVSLHLAKLLHQKGYNKYSPEQYAIDDDKVIGKSNLSLENCAYVELTTPKRFIYIPTLDEAYNWVRKQDPNWIVSVLWDNRVKGFYFIVQNIETGYKYKQPPAPQENNEFMMYEWGIEHVLNRLNEEINNDDD